MVQNDGSVDAGAYDATIAGPGHAVVRTRSGRFIALYLTRTGAGIGANWSYSDNYSNGNWTNGGLVWSDGNVGVFPQLGIDSGDSVHAAWTSTSASRAVWYGYMSPTHLGWSGFISVISYASACNAFLCLNTNNYITIVSSTGTKAAEASIDANVSSNNGVTWSGSSPLQNTAGPVQLCADSTGLVHCVYNRTDGAYLTIRYRNFNPSTLVWGAETEINPATDAYDQTSPSICVDWNDDIHITWLGRWNVAPAFDSVRYINKISGSWGAVQNLSSEATAAAKFPCISIDYNAGTQNAYVSYAGYSVPDTAYRIWQTSAAGAAFNSWSAPAIVSTYSAIAMDASASIYQRTPIWMVPKTGWGLTYDEVVGNFDPRCSMTATTAADWNEWQALTFTVTGKMDLTGAKMIFIRSPGP